MECLFADEVTLMVRDVIGRCCSCAFDCRLGNPRSVFPEPSRVEVAPSPIRWLFLVIDDAEQPFAGRWSQQGMTKCVFFSFVFSDLVRIQWQHRQATFSFCLPTREKKSIEFLSHSHRFVRLSDVPTSSLLCENSIALRRWYLWNLRAGLRWRWADGHWLDECGWTGLSRSTSLAESCLSWARITSAIEWTTQSIRHQKRRGRSISRSNGSTGYGSTDQCSIQSLSISTVLSASEFRGDLSHHWAKSPLLSCPSSTTISQCDRRYSVRSSRTTASVSFVGKEPSTRHTEQRIDIGTGEWQRKQTSSDAEIKLFTRTQTLWCFLDYNSSFHFHRESVFWSLLDFPRCSYLNEVFIRFLSRKWLITSRQE